MAQAYRVTNIKLVLCLLCFFVASDASAQKAAPAKHGKSKAPPPAVAPAEPVAEPTPPPPPPKPVEDPLGRTSPYGCVSGFLSAVNSQNFTKAVQYLDTKLPQDQAEQLASQLKAVLDAGLSSGINSLSHDPLGDLRDDLRISREKIGVIEAEGGGLDILLDRVSRPGEPNIWLFSSETLEKIPNIHAKLDKNRDLSRFFPAPFFQKTFFNIPVWRWMSLLIGIPLLLLLSSIVTRLLFLVLRLVMHKRRNGNEKEVLNKLQQPVRLLFLSLAVTFVVPLSLSVLARSYWTAASRALGIVGFAWLLARLADTIGHFAERRSLETGARQKIAVITLGRRLFKIIAFLIVLLFFFRGAGIDVSAMLAGLGIGGIALAFAAQKTLEDLFGGISIILRDSIRVGDMCRVADQTGFIEDIGLSSTRLRTLDRTIVSIPNSKVAQFNSENFALRDKFWFHHILSLSPDTTNDQIQEIAANIKTLLDHSDEIEIGTNRINFIGVSGSLPQFEIFAYLLSSTYDLFLVEQQRLLIKVMAIISDAGTHLSSLSQIAFGQGQNAQPNPATTTSQK